jgi:hypothetical protein
MKSADSAYSTEILRLSEGNSNGGLAMRWDTSSEAGMMQIAGTCARAVLIPAAIAVKHLLNVWLLIQAVTTRVIVEAPR